MLKSNIYRIIDANINRISEALRVIEDWSRFAKDSLLISKKLKSIRHELNTQFLKYSNLILYRESTSDVGREIENPSPRNSVKDIIKANCKRIEEGLRVICEYAQLVDIDVKNLENKRYEIYSIEKELLKNEKSLRLHSASLYLVASKNTEGQSLSDTDFFKIIEQSIEGGIDIVQLREKEEKENKILYLAKEIKKLIANTNAIFIINDHVDIALACDADGVHLGQEDMAINEVCKVTPEGFIIGLSTHNIEQGQSAIKTFKEISKPNYLGVGPVFPTPTKPNYKAAGLEYVRWASNNLKDIPWFAIGGIDETNINSVIDSGARQVAVVRAIMNTKNPQKMTMQLKETLDKSAKDYAQIR